MEHARKEEQTLKYGMLTFFMRVWIACPQLEHTPGNTNISSSEIGCSSPRARFMVSSLVDSSSWAMRPRATFCSNVLWYVRRFHFGSAVLPTNSIQLLPDGSSSLTVNGVRGASLSEAFLILVGLPSNSVSSSSSSAKIVLIFPMITSIFSYPSRFWIFRSGWSRLRSVTTSRIKPSIVVSWPLEVGGRVRANSGIAISHDSERTIWRFKSDLSKTLAV